VRRVAACCLARIQPGDARLGPASVGGTGSDGQDALPALGERARAVCCGAPCNADVARRVAGIANFVDPYLSTVRKLLKRPDSSFLLQVSGLRQGANWQDVAWGLFMSKYIFPGADASTPLHWYAAMLALRPVLRLRDGVAPCRLLARLAPAPPVLRARCIQSLKQGPGAGT
jgi:hypothetical protein